MKALIIKYSNYADNECGLHTKKLVADSFGEMMAELAAWAMQPAYVVGGFSEHKVFSIGWQREGQFKLEDSNASNFIDVVKKLLLAESDVDRTLIKKAAKYDAITEANRLNGQKSASSMTAEARRERAKKAVAARIKKYGH